MKKFLTYLLFLPVLSVFTHCVHDPLKKEHLDASYTYVVLGSDTTKIPDSVKVTDNIVFKSITSGGDTYTIFTGNIPQNAYLRTYTTQSKWGAGINLTKTANGTFRSPSFQFPTPGNYKIYMIATFVDLKTGKFKRTVDSSLTIKVYNPYDRIGLITSFKLKASNDTSNTKPKGGGVSQQKGLPISAVIKGDSIIFDNFNKAWRGYFRSCLFDYTATSNNIKIDGQPLSTTITKGNPLDNGSIVTIYPNKGGDSTVYHVRISYFTPPPSSDPTIASAVIGLDPSYGSAHFSWSCNGIVSGSSITIPSWPVGTVPGNGYISVNYTDKSGYSSHVDSVFTRLKPLSLTVKAQDSVSTAVYQIIPPTTVVYASVSNLQFTSSKGVTIIKQDGTNYDIYVAYAADLSNAKLQFDLGTYTQLKYTTD